MTQVPEVHELPGAAGLHAGAAAPLSQLRLAALDFAELPEELQAIGSGTVDPTLRGTYVRNLTISVLNNYLLLLLLLLLLVGWGGGPL